MNKIDSSKAKEVFKSAGKFKGLEMWRIEKLEAVPWPRSEYGKFYTGDSYVILSTDEINGVLSYNIHYWVGNESTEDGAAAVYTVLLGDHLGGCAPQHREHEGHESNLFQSYFKYGVRYLYGGFKKVTTTDVNDPRLFLMWGKRNIRICEVEVNIKSMNQNDYFLLDSGRKIFVYPPMTSKSKSTPVNKSTSVNKFQSIRANDVANKIRDQDHYGRATVHILVHPIPFDDRKEFFGILGCSNTSPELPEVPEEKDDDDIEMKENVPITLYNATTKLGYFTTTTGGLLKISTEPLVQEMLKSDICSILDTGVGIYVWIGKESSTDDKALAMLKAQEFIAKNNYPKWTQLHRVVEGAEPVQFKQHFATWRETQQHRIRHKKRAGKDSIEFHPSTLHKRKGDRGGFMSDDNGKGNYELWRVHNRNLVLVQPERRGMFFDKNCYLVKYSAVNKRGSVLYIWQGRHASVLDKGASAIQTVNMAEKMEGGTIQVLVNQGYEPLHFFKIFVGKFIILCGSHEEFVNNINDGIQSSKIRLFKVRGTNEYNVHAEQLNAVAASLASDDVFILVTPTCTYIWFGIGASSTEQSIAFDSVERISPGIAPIKVAEGEEPPEFWDLLGGKADYDTELSKPGIQFMDTRLFHCKVRNDGKFVVREIFNFYQDDLDAGNVFILDGGEEIYVWEGKDCSEEEKEKSMQLANTYIETDPSARTPESVHIITIQQDNEPKSFKQLFPKWKNDFQRENKSTGHSTSYGKGSAPNPLIDVTGYFNGCSTIGLAADVVDLTHVPFVQCSVYPIQNRTDLRVIDLSDDRDDNNSNNEYDESIINQSLDLLDKMIFDIQNPSMPDIVDLTEEELPLYPIASRCHSEFPTIQDSDTSAHRTSWDEQNSTLPLPVVVDSIESRLRPVSTPEQSNQSANDETSLDYPALHSPIVVDFTEEFQLYPSTCSSEFSRTQVTEDCSNDVALSTHSNDITSWNKRNTGPQMPVVLNSPEPPFYVVRTFDSSNQSASDETSWDEQNSTLLVAVESTESHLRPPVTVPSNQSASTMDWQNSDDTNELNEHLESLRKKISALENVVVDLNDDYDTSFQLIDEYKTQSCQIYKRIKKITGKSVKRLNDRIKFNGTPYPEFNAKLEKYVNRKKRLPLFDSVLKKLKVYIQDNNLQLNEEDCNRLVDQSLMKIQKKLQQQRCVSLNETFSYYTKNQIDPAELDPELKAKLDRRTNQTG